MDPDPVAMNIAGVRQLVGSRMNKTLDGPLANTEGVEGQFKDELELDMSDEDLLKLKKRIETEWQAEEAKIRIRQQANLSYYLGTQKTSSPEATQGMVVSDNIIFEAVETLVPASLAKNPEPVVFSDDTPEGEQLADDVKTMLQYHAENMSMRSMMNLSVRKWLMDLLAVTKHGWDTEIKDLYDDVRDVKNFIFDINGYIDVHCCYVGTLGERIKSTAQELIDLFPEHKTYITILVDGNLGTEVIRTEWWNDKYTFTSFKEKILDKSKNPHFNYDKKSKDIDGEDTTETAENHFARPLKPYTFFSVFSLGEKAHDVTGLIEQNIPNQKRISKRTEQIDYNLSRQNNSEVFSENNFNQETATQAKNARLKGNAILIPQGGPIADAIDTLEAKGLDASFFNDLENQKTALRMSFGTEGLTASPPDKNELATGIIANEQHDSSRIGGGIGDALERYAKQIFNQHVQFYYVYYTVEHVGQIMGQMQAIQYGKLKNDRFSGKKLVVSISPDSMKPRDEVSEMNEAITLYQEKALDPKTLLTKIHFPDPQQTAEQTCLWLTSPETYMQINFPEIQQQIEAMQQKQMQQQQQMEAQQAQQQAQAGQAQMQQQGQAAQQSQQIQGQNAQQGMAIKQATTEQNLRLKEAEHQQKLKHQDEAQKAKLEQQKASIKSKTLSGKATLSAKKKEKK